MQLTNLNYSFTTQKTLEYTTLVLRRFMAANRYTEVMPAPSNALTFQKKRKGLGFNALEWGSTLNMQLETSDQQGMLTVSIQAEINTTGQMVFAAEMAKWQAFLENIGHCVNDTVGNDLTKAQHNVNHEVRSFFARILPGAIAGAAIMATVLALAAVVIKHLS